MGDIIEQDAVESVNLSLPEEYISNKERLFFWWYACRYWNHCSHEVKDASY